MACFDQNETAQRIIRWTIFGMSIVTWIFSIVAVAHCSFLKFTYPFRDDQLQGAYNYETGGRCVRYSDLDKDDRSSAEKSGAAFGTLAAFCMSVTMLLVLSIELCLKYRVEMVWLTIRILFIVTAVCQVLAFTAFADQDCKDFKDADGYGCTAGAAGAIGATNVILLVILSVLTWLVPAPRLPVFKVTVVRYTDEERPPPPPPRVPAAGKTEVSEVGAGEETVKETIVEGDDGKTTTIKEVTRGDGSKTVTTTVEVMNEDGSKTQTVTVEEYGSAPAGRFQEPEIEVAAPSSGSSGGKSNSKDTQSGSGKKKKINVFEA